MPEIDVAELSPRDRYRLLTATVIPRPIAWVSTLSADGRGNLAPFSYFMAVSATPPVLAFSAGRKRGDGDERPPKDTLANVLATREFTVNLVTEAQAQAMVATSAALDHGVDEFDEAGLERAPAAKVKPPRVKGAPVAWECVLYDVVPIDRSRARPQDPPVSGHSTLVLGEVVHVHVDDAVIDAATGLPDPDRLAPVARLGGSSYWRRGDVFDVPRPSP